MKRYPVLRDWRLNIFKKEIIIELIYRLNIIPMKISAAIFAEIYKEILKFIWDMYGKIAWDHIHESH